MKTSGLFHFTIGDDLLLWLMYAAPDIMGASSLHVEIPVFLFPKCHAHNNVILITQFAIFM